MTPEEIGSYILMERLFPDSFASVLVRESKVACVDAISEFGVYGVHLCDGAGAPLLNAPAGYLIRTKTVGTNEGGVATGYAVIDSLLLVEN